MKAIAKLIFAGLFIFFILNFTSCDEDVAPSNVIDFKQLPDAAQAFINDYFSGYTMQKAVEQSITYEVFMKKLTANADVYEIIFDQAGLWLEIRAKNNSALPDNIFLLIPKSIISYVIQYYPVKSITRIKKNASGYAIVLTGKPNLELEFDFEGNYTTRDAIAREPEEINSVDHWLLCSARNQRSSTIGR